MLTIEFNTPFTRSALRTTVTALAVSFPTLTYTFRAAARQDDYLDTPDAENDLIQGMKVDGFADVQEAGRLLDSLPAGVNGRITEIAYQ